MTNIQQNYMKIDDTIYADAVVLSISAKRIQILITNFVQMIEIDVQEQLLSHDIILTDL